MAGSEALGFFNGAPRAVTGQEIRILRCGFFGLRPWLARIAPASLGLVAG
jgi:hypothetical protein